MSVKVRRAAAKDARAVAEYAVKLADQHQDYSARRFSRLATVEQAEQFYGSQADSEQAAVLVAEAEGKIVGFAYIQFEARNYASLLENAAWLHDIYIDEAARGQNAGKLLIEEAICAAKAFGANKLMLMAATENERALKIFERSGFKHTMVEMMLDLIEKKQDD